MPVTDAAAIEDVADTLFNAIEQTDIAMIQQLWNDDVAVWHSGDPKDNDRARAMRVICWFIDNTTARRYQILDRQLFEDARLHRDQVGRQRPHQPHRRVLRPQGHDAADVRLRQFSPAGTEVAVA